MTKKRFTLKHFESTDWAYDNGKPIYTKEMVELLNELHDENEQLKQRIKVLENTIDGLTGTIAHFDLDEVMGND